MNPFKRPRYYILDADNRPVPADLMTWAMFWGGHDRRVAYTEVTSQVHVSTVFLGIDHRHFGDGPPLLFETMIFGGSFDQSQWRYSSWDDAKTGHKAAVTKARAKAKAKT